MYLPFSGTVLYLHCAGGEPTRLTHVSLRFTAEAAYVASFRKGAARQPEHAWRITES